MILGTSLWGLFEKFYLLRVVKSEAVGFLSGRSGLLNSDFRRIFAFIAVIGRGFA